MPLSTQGIAARWLLFMAALTTLPHLSTADDNFTDYDWLNETQLLEMFDYENNTEWNSTEVDVDVDVDASLDSINEGETVGEALGEAVGEAVGKTVGEAVGEAVGETVGEAVGEAFLEKSNGSRNEDDVVGAAVGETVVKAVVEKSNSSRNEDFPFEHLRQHRHFARIVFMVVLLHVAVVGVCITIYSLVYCKVRTLKKLQRAKAQRCLRLMNLQSRHVPNSRECPCSGCIMTREMLQGLFLHQLHELVEC